MKQMEVQIMQQSYLLACPDGREARLLEAVSRVDGAMTQIRDAGKVKARERIAVLAALNLAFELIEPAPPKTAEEAPHAGSADAEHLLPEQCAQLQALMQKLDEALKVDGQLL